MRRASLYVLIFICLLFIAAKIQHLSLPFFWDEAWPYSTGVFYMYSHGLSLLPGGVPFDISRGHPLFFHFVSALWMKIFGTSLSAIHSFPLVLSILLIICVYFFCTKFFSNEVALVACVLIMVQPVFYSQSAMLLPEILVALLTLLTFWSFLVNRKLLYVLFASLLLLTKESGIVIVITLFGWTVIEKIREHKPQIFLSTLKSAVYLFTPVAIASVFFIIQKLKTGYFFLPIYISGDNISWMVFSEKLKNYFAYIFIYQGRNILSIGLIVAIAVILYRKIQITAEHKRIILPAIIFSILYLVFSSLSFYSPRYMLSIFPFLAIISSYLVYSAMEKKPVIYPALLICIAGASVFYCFNKKRVVDHSPGFADGIAVTQNAIAYCEAENMFDKKIYSSFLVRMHLTHPEHGYLSGNKIFEVVDNLDTSVRVCIFPSFERDETSSLIKHEGSFKLVKRFEKNYAWCDIYQREN